MTLAIEIEDVFRVFATEEGTAAALQGLSLTVQPEEIVAVLGPSGSGKTTLLRILGGFDHPSAGQVRVLGLDLRRLRGRSIDRFRARVLGYADQRYGQALAPELTCRELVSLRLALAGEPLPRRERLAEELLERIGLADRGSAHPRELSGGEQQRVALCASLAHRPRLLLADEPTGELDAANAALVYQLIGELAREQGTTVVVVSHDPSSASIADRIVHIRDGRVSAESARREPDAEEIVVARGGWLRLPEELLRRTGISSRARARLEEQTIVVEATQDGPAPAEPVQDQRPAAVPGDVVVEVRGVDKSIGTGRGERRMFSGLTTDIRAGLLTVVTGPSGSGKTTLLDLLVGLQLPDAGEVVVLGTSVAGLDRSARAELRRRPVAYVAQEPPLVSFLSTLENVALYLGLRGVDEPERSERARDALAVVGLSQLETQRVSRLSTGEHERVAIARALAAEPALLIADEPTARLDHANALAVGALLARIARERNVGVVCATHDPVVIEQADAQISLVG